MSRGVANVEANDVEVPYVEVTAEAATSATGAKGACREDEMLKLYLENEYFEETIGGVVLQRFVPQVDLERDGEGPVIAVTGESLKRAVMPLRTRGGYLVPVRLGRFLVVRAQLLRVMRARYLLTLRAMTSGDAA